MLHAAQDLSFAAVCEVYRLIEGRSTPFELASHDFYLPALPTTGHKCRSRVLLGDSISTVYTIRNMLHNAHTQTNSCSDTDNTCSSISSSFQPHRYHFVLQDIYGVSIARGTWDGSRLSGTSNADPERAGSYEQLFAVWDILVDGEVRYIYVHM